jgi:GTP-binding protein Era
LIEDAAQAIDSYYKGKPLGSFGDLAAFSFHETKNIISGEGGLLVINNPEFIARAEIIREKIFLNYKKEVPYSCEVVITAFKESDDIIKVSSEIYEERATQRAILLGHKGERIKIVGTEARKEMEQFFGKKVFLEQYIKVEPDWRQQKNKLERFGY